MIIISSSFLAQRKNDHILGGVVKNKKMGTAKSSNANKHNQLQLCKRECRLITCNDVSVKYQNDKKSSANEGM